MNRRSEEEVEKKRLLDERKRLRGFTRGYCESNSNIYIYEYMNITTHKADNIRSIHHELGQFGHFFVRVIFVLNQIGYLSGICSYFVVFP
jgi:hypothetical protein